MANRRDVSSRLAALALFATAILAAATGCSMVPHALYGKRISGQVVDADTGQAISGVHVAFVWESTIIPSGFTGHNSRTICYHAAATTTDANGHFQIEPWRKWSTYNVDVSDPIALVYARGYTPRQIVLQEGPIEPPRERISERYALKRFAGSVDERLDAMWGGIANRGCTYGGESQKSLYPMLKAIYEEARQIAASPEHRRTVGIMAILAAKAGLARDPNGPGNDDEIRNFIEENFR
jgi:hypothetical protein